MIYRHFRSALEKLDYYSDFKTRHRQAGSFQLSSNISYMCCRETVRTYREQKVDLVLRNKRIDQQYPNGGRTTTSTIGNIANLSSSINLANFDY